ncbi:MAG: hypothetical protein BMS9Abin23_0034 [Thermodesulfobacteriota bacterium]|nr:MAG: hypothetical protein BMS9Abin23_0034 [Thermodesulfobacteriota bacterium]
MKTRLIIPIFIPFGGCANICVFCDQKGITGLNAPPSTTEVRETVKTYLSTWKGRGRREVAFYGGTFTALPLDIQRAYLECVEQYLSNGLIHGLRVSTRPDAVSDDIVSFLKRHSVDTVELGVQSMDDRVLALSGRGHSAGDTVRAVKILKEHGMKVGVQVMPGLPGDDIGSVMDTAWRVARLSPDFIRVYPAVVIKGTVLERMYLDGRYTPWTLDEMVSACKKVSAVFRLSGIRIIRMGLHATGELREKIVAGPYHPSFRNLVDTAPDISHRQPDEGGVK